MRFSAYVFVLFSLATSYSLAAIENEIDDFDEDTLELELDIAEFNDESENSTRQWRVNIAGQNGVDLNALDNTRSRRLDFRLDWGQLVFKDYFLKLDGKIIFRLPGDDNQSNQTKTALDGRLRELYIQSSVDRWTMTAGFQTLSLGEMDAVQVADVLSPWDYSEFAFTAPEDARLGQLLFNVEWYAGQSRWQFIYSPWPMINRYPGDTSIIQQLLGNQPIEINENQPEPLADNEYLLAWQKNIGGSDITLIYANLLSNDPIFNLTSTENATLMTFETEYYRFDFFSISANYSAGNFLWKYESAYKRGMKYQAQSIIDSAALDLAIGVDYDANGAWNISVEMLNQHLLASENTLGALNKNSTQLLVRWSKNWLYETLSSVFFVSYQLQYGDIITSLALDYAIDDHWKTSIVGSIFDSSDSQSPGQLTKNWDQLTLRVNFSY